MSGPEMGQEQGRFPNAAHGSAERNVNRVMATEPLTNNRRTTPAGGGRRGGGLCVERTHHSLWPQTDLRESTPPT